MKLTCAQLDALLPDVFAGDLAPATEAAAAQHLATCNECRLTVSDLEQVGDLGRRHGKLELPAETKARIRALFSEG